MRPVKILLILGGVAAALLLLAELIVRFAFPVPMEPSGRLVFTNDLKGIKSSVDFRYDGDLLRKVGWSGKRRSENLRILCVGGGGTTLLLQSAPDTWWGLLASGIAEASGKKVEVAALADLQGGGILSGLVRAEKVTDKYDVDLIIASFGFGDAIGKYGDYRFDPGALQRMREAEPPGWKYQLAKASHLLRIVRNWRRARSQRSLQARLAEPNFYRNYLATMNYNYSQRPMAQRIVRTGDDPLEEYLLGLDGLVELAGKRGAKLLVVGEPTIYKSTLGPAEAKRLTEPWYPTAPVQGKRSGVRLPPLVMETELNRFYRAAKARCEAAGVGWVNLQGEIPRYADSFLSEILLTDAGCRQVAEELLEPVMAALGESK